MLADIVTYGGISNFMSLGKKVLVYIYLPFDLFTKSFALLAIIFQNLLLDQSLYFIGQLAFIPACTVVNRSTTCVFLQAISIAFIFRFLLDFQMF